MEDLEFSKRLLNALETKDMRPIDLANKTGINKGIISMYLSGKCKPKNHNMEIIAKALSINVFWLMGYDVPIDSNISMTSNERAVENERINGKQFEEKLNQNTKLELLEIEKEITKLAKEDIKDFIKYLQEML